VWAIDIASVDVERRLPIAIAEWRDVRQLENHAGIDS
jgi:hypothetical protein